MYARMEGGVRASGSLVERERLGQSVQYRLKTGPSANGAPKHAERVAVVGHFEHDPAGIADLPHGRQRAGPVDRALEGDEVVVERAFVVVDVGRHDMPRKRL